MLSVTLSPRVPRLHSNHVTIPHFYIILSVYSYFSRRILIAQSVFSSVLLPDLRSSDDPIGRFVIKGGA